LVFASLASRKFPFESTLDIDKVGVRRVGISGKFPDSEKFDIAVK
jgi:hypothetical protein